MIQVLHRAFDIIELISSDNTKMWSLGEIASTLALNNATCANIIKTMVTRNYLEQQGPKKGYKLGYMAYQIIGNNPFEERLKRAATNAMERLGNKINETNLLAILRKNNRVIVHQVHAEHDLMVRSSTEKDAYNSASGRLLIAMLNGEEQDIFIEKYGLPDSTVWPEARTEKDLKKELQIIREQGYARQKTTSHILGIAHPIKNKNITIASLSVYLPISRINNQIEIRILDALRDTVIRIEENLT